MNIVYQIRPVRSGNKFPDDINLSELENKIQGSFKIKGEKVIDGYFDEESEYYPKNLLFFIFARNKKNDGLIGGVVATSEEINDFKFTGSEAGVEYVAVLFSTETSSFSVTPSITLPFDDDWESGTLRAGVSVNVLF